MSDDKKISIAVIKRLPRYYRYLGDLLDNDINRISSKELSFKMNLTASQIRQDLNNFGCFGQQGYGYNVEFLYNEIGKILGLSKTYNMIIIGAGNLGQALINYDKFLKRGFKFIGIFDTNTKIVGKSLRGITVMDYQNIEDFLLENKVDIAVLTIPRTNALEVSKKITKLGVRGIWNFSNTELQTIDDVVIENVHLTDSLMTLSYRLNEK